MDCELTTGENIASPDAVKTISESQRASIHSALKCAKVYVVRSLLQRISTLRKKKGSEQQLLKYQRKVERMFHVINTLKEFIMDNITQLTIHVLHGNASNAYTQMWKCCNQPKQVENLLDSYAKISDEAIKYNYMAYLRLLSCKNLRRKLVAISNGESDDNGEFEDVDLDKTETTLHNIDNLIDQVKLSKKKRKLRKKIDIYSVAEHARTHHGTEESAENEMKTHEPNDKISLTAKNRKAKRNIEVCNDVQNTEKRNTEEATQNEKNTDPNGKTNPVAIERKRREQDNPDGDDKTEFEITNIELSPNKVKPKNKIENYIKNDLSQKKSVTVTDENIRTKFDSNSRNLIDETATKYSKIDKKNVRSRKEIKDAKKNNLMTLNDENSNSNEADVEEENGLKFDDFFMNDAVAVTSDNDEKISIRTSETSPHLNFQKSHLNKTVVTNFVGKRKNRRGQRARQKMRQISDPDSSLRNNARESMNRRGKQSTNRWGYNKPGHNVNKNRLGYGNKNKNLSERMTTNRWGYSNNNEKPRMNRWGYKENRKGIELNDSKRNIKTQIEKHIEKTNIARKESHDKVEADKSLHPSWQAKQRMKAQQGIAVFGGTKITFD